jgi:hypothetical protein
MLPKIAKDIKKFIKEEGVKVLIYFAVKSTGDDYDPEDRNYTYTNLNPKCIKAWVSQISPEKLVWKQYGLVEQGALELITDSKYTEWFKKCNRIVINEVDYSVYKVGADSRVLVQVRPGNLIRVVLEKKG